MNRQDGIELFTSLYPRFFEGEGIRALPKEAVFEEMALWLSEFDPNGYNARLGEEVDFGLYEGDFGALKTEVAKVSSDWVQFFGEGDRVFCGYIGGKIASFCLVDDMGTHRVNGKTLKIGGPGCVGTVPEFRNRGIGLTMVKLATELLRDEGFDVSYIHYTAVADWYAKLGYQITLKWGKNGIEPSL